MKTSLMTHQIAAFLTLCLVAAPSIAWSQAKSGQKLDPVPPPGIEVAEEDQKELAAGLTSLDKLLSQLAERKDETTKALLPDVQIFSTAVRTAIDHHEFFAPADVKKAKELLKTGTARAEQLLAGEPAWLRARGLVPRGYVSRIDGSVQPYGLVVPESYRPGGNDKFRLDVWLHGRNEKLSEVNFLDERLKQAGQFTPPATIVLHPYGRFCNAFKFAGEVDVWEAIEDVKRQYRIDDDRIAIRGFSMGGAGCWHLAVHYADRWVAAAPGAGFADTVQYMKMSDDEVAALPDWQRKLFHLYDSNDWALNLFQCPTVAYSGEIDKQKLAADTMEHALAADGIKLRHIIGPNTEHKYHPEAKKTLSAAIDSIAEVGRDRHPLSVKLVTYTLKYNRMAWLQVEGLAEHWQESRVAAEISSSDEVFITTENVTDLKIDFPPGWSPFDLTANVVLTVDDQEVNGPRTLSDRSFTCQLHRDDQGQWQLGPREGDGLRKRHNLQGPIDDAFMESFIIVRPTGKSAHEKVNQWTASELDRAIRQWRTQFRGEARVKNDTDITDKDIASSNLILWGDAQSNALIKRIADRLPIRWDGKELVADQKRFDAENHLPVLIYPNPLNPNHYVVLNSGFTFREADFYSSNARQVPRLPDWAILDLKTPPDFNRPGTITAAGFFGENWELNPAKQKPETPKTASTR